MVLGVDGLDCGTTTIDGSWLFEDAPGWRDAGAQLTFTVEGDLTGNAGGSLRMRAGHRLAFDTVTAPRVFTVHDGFLLDIQGSVHETAIAALVDDPANPVDCGEGAPGREFTIAPLSGASVAHKAGRVVFQSGRARNRQMEIRAASANEFRICTDTTDAASGSDTSGGQRLTPHANRSAFCTSAGEPSACCTGWRAGTCPTTPVSRHSEPAPYGNAACGGPRAPYPCCAGAGIGTCTGAIPAVGDRIAIVDDAWIYQSAGANGYRIVGDLAAGNDPMPIIKGANIANAGTHTLQTTSSIEFTAKADIPTPDMEYVNFHDYAPGVDGIRYYNVRDWTVRWSAFHDVTPNTQGDTNATLAASSWRGPSADNVHFVDNVFYRTQGVGPHLNEGGFLPAAGCRFLRNLLFDSCLAGPYECGGLQADSCTGGEAAYNVVYDYHNGANPASGAFTLDMKGFGASIHHNWVVNSSHGPGAGGWSVTEIQSTGLSHNYVSHTVGEGGNGGSYFSNVIRNFGLGQEWLASGIVNPVRATGNYILGVEPGIQSSADCTGTNRCGRVGIRYIKLPSNCNRRSTTALDNLVVSLASYAGDGGDGRCIEFDGWHLSGGGDIDADWDATVAHLTCDGRSPSIPIGGLSFDQGSTPMSPAITVGGLDLAMLYNNDGHVASCAGVPGVDEILQNVHSLKTLEPSESGGHYADASTCTSATAISMVPSFGYVDSWKGDYNLTPGSPGLTAGAEPPGSPIGARAFRFSRESLQSLWATDPGVASDFCTGPETPSPCCTGSATGTCSASILTFDGEFPADVANVDNRDTDGDGVLDLHDNNAEAWNPGQFDPDGDGIGDLTDCDDANPICDNCPLDSNPLQEDRDGDRQGDACDLDDGVVFLVLPDGVSVSWQFEAGFDSFNEYRGDLGVLRSSRLYTQDPRTTPGAARNCFLTDSSVTDGPDPPTGQAYFYLVSGRTMGIEGSLGTDSSGDERVNSIPCAAP